MVAGRGRQLDLPLHAAQYGPKCCILNGQIRSNALEEGGEWEECEAETPGKWREEWASHHLIVDGSIRKQRRKSAQLLSAGDLLLFEDGRQGNESIPKEAGRNGLEGSAIGRNNFVARLFKLSTAKC